MQDPSGGGSSRFPPIAPRDAASQSPISQSHLDPSNIASTSDARRQRPPRSRAGCWTCRTRKVKCDEKRPSCGQCRRLGHSCDYNPRLAFKDDTPRVMERMQEDVSTIGSSVWNPNARRQRSPQQVSVEDLLPPFSALTTDEEREKKAESRDPGTLYVIANPRSFESLPEYRNESKFDTDKTHGSSFSEAHREDSYGAESDMSGKGHLGTTEDPNTVILARFEDPHRRAQPRPSRTPSENPDTPPEASISIVAPSAILTSSSDIDSRNSSMLEVARQGGKDAPLLQHYRTAISQGLRHADTMGRNEDIFETHARVYPPLFHALMALSALSISQKNGGNSADSLEHYQKVIPALKEMVQNSRDSYSDGALFTHYILLVYEVSVIGDHDSNMWEHHLNQLLRIVTLRRQTNGDEPYAFLVWQIYCIDIHAVLSCSGSASFVEGVLERNMVPPPEKVLAMWSPGTPFHPSEEPYFPALIKVNQEAFSIACQVGQLARILREEAIQRALGTSAHQPSEPVFHFNRRTRIQALIQLIQHVRDACDKELPDCHKWAHGSDRLPPRVFASSLHSYLLVRACILYVYTSMYPGQLFDPPPNYEVQVSKCSQEIIEAAKNIISKERFELRVIVFPLFMAGYSTMDPAEKLAALDLMRKQEQHSYGGSTAGVRRLLETVCEKQATDRDFKSVDWIEEMRTSGQRLVMCGL